MELGPSLETQRHRGRQDHMDKPLLFSIPWLAGRDLGHLYFLGPEYQQPDLRDTKVDEAKLLRFHCLTSTPQQPGSACRP